MNKISLFFIITLIHSISFGEKQIFYDKIYDKDIKTAIIRAENSKFSYPIISLNSDQKLILSFDDLNSENQVFDYQYTIIHCNADWTQSNLDFSDYIDGFEENDITDFDNSFNTLIDFVHYEVSFPNDFITFRLSGNYVIVVYKNNNIEDTVLTKRFAVSENTAIIEGNVHLPMITSYKNTHQQVDFTVTSGDFSTGNPLQYVSVSVLQNNRPDVAKTGLKPRFYKGNQLIFDDPMQNIFVGNNEFRFFDTRNPFARNDRVAKIEKKDLYNFYLVPEKEQTQYFFNKDLNGRFLLGNIRGREPAVDADYVWVHFYLQREFPYPDNQVYIVGEFTNWQKLDDFKMTYNADYQVYQAKILLKQGYYNYTFLLEKNDNFFSIDGNFSETHNNYVIYVYYHDVAMNYDRLIATKVI